MNRIQKQFKVERIGIIGGGAMGLLFAAYLTKSGYLTTLYVRREEQQKCIIQNGLTLQNHNLEKVYPQVKVLKNELDIASYDVLIIAVKQYQLTSTLIKAISMSQSSNVLFIQNGMGHVGKLSDLESTSVILGIVEHGATKYADNIVAHKGIGVTKLALYKGQATVFEKMKLDSHFPFVFENDWKAMLTEKLLINHSINPLTALYHVTNGQLISNSFFYQSMRTLFLEGERVFFQKHQPTIWDKIVSICQSTSANRSSMLQDIEAGRQTEIEAISGYLLDQARHQGFDLPITHFVVSSILGLQQESEGKKR